MHWLPFIFVFFAGLNYDAYTEETTEKVTFGSKVQVVAFPSRTYPPTTTDIADTQVSFGSSSFQGSCALAASEEVTPQAICDNGFGKLWPMEMPRLQETLQGNGTVLPLLWDRLVPVCRQLVHPRSALQRLVLGESSAMEWSHTWLEFTKDKIGFRKKAFETFTPVREERKRERQGEELRDSQRRSAVKESICSSFGSLALDWRCGDYSDDLGCQCYATTQSSFRSAVSLEENVPRSSADAVRTTGCGGEDRGPEQQTSDSGLTCCNVTVGTCKEIPRRFQRGALEAQEGLVHLLGRVCHGLEGTTGCLLRKGAAFEGTGREVKARDCTNYESNSAAHQQECGRERTWSYIPSDSPCRGSRRTGGRSGGEEAQRSSSGSPSTMPHFGQGRGRNHHGRIRQGRSRWGESPCKTPKVSRSKWRAWASICCWWYVNNGSAVECPRNHLREPKQVRFIEEVEAYQPVIRIGAACRLMEIATLQSFAPTISWTHSIGNEEDFVNPYVASIRALELRFQTISHEFESLLDDIPHQPIHGRLLDDWYRDAFLPSTSTSDTQIDFFEIDQGQAPLLIIDEWEELRTLLSGFATESAERVQLVMYGLFQADIGTRHASANPDIESVRASVLQTWSDFLLPDTTAFLHLVRPQEFVERNEIHFIVEFSNQVITLPNNDIPILRRIMWHGVAEQESDTAAAYLSPGSHSLQILLQSGLTDWCHPWTRTICNVHIEKRILLTLVQAQLLQGSLVEIFIHNEYPDEDIISAMQVGLWPKSSHPHVFDRCCGGNGFVAEAALADSSASYVCREDQEGNSVKGTPGLFIQRWKPNQQITIPFDENIPDIQHTPAGPILRGRIIPPPRWQQNALFRSAVAAGTVFRGVDGHLNLRIRSWLIKHGSPVEPLSRDFVIRPQLMIQLPQALRRVWRDRIAGHDSLILRVVRPCPPPDADGSHYFHIIAEVIIDPTPETSRSYLR